MGYLTQSSWTIRYWYFSDIERSWKKSVSSGDFAIKKRVHEAPNPNEGKFELTLGKLAHDADGSGRLQTQMDAIDNCIAIGANVITLRKRHSVEMLRKKISRPQTSKNSRGEKAFVKRQCGRRSKSRS